MVLDLIFVLSWILGKMMILKILGVKHMVWVLGWSAFHDTVLSLLDGASLSLSFFPILDVLFLSLRREICSSVVRS